MTRLLRWVLVPLAALAGFLLAIPLSVPMNRFLRAMLPPMPSPIWVNDVAIGYDGALAGFLVVACATYAAPAAPVLVALTTFAVGAVVAWSIVGHWESAAHHVGGPVRIWWPIVGTYAGGLAGVVLAVLRSQRHGRTMPPKVVEASPEPFNPPIGRMANGTECRHDGETSNYCTRCWTPLKPGVR